MRLLELLDGFRSKRVAVIGDLIADEFIYGRVARLSREAPVLILQYDSTQIRAGGAGNAANNVAALGARAHIVALAGKDEAGTRLVASLGRVGTVGLVRPVSYSRRSRHAFLPAGSTPPSSRSSGSIAWRRPATTRRVAPHSTARR